MAMVKDVEDQFDGQNPRKWSKTSSHSVGKFLSSDLIHTISDLGQLILPLLVEQNLLAFACLPINLNETNMSNIHHEC